MRSSYLTDGCCGRATGGTMFGAGSSVEALEPRRLLAAAPHTSAPVDIVGEYSGAAHVVFSPRTFHAPATDSIAVTISNEASDGSVAGTLEDEFGGTLMASGTISGRTVSLDLRGPQTTGRLTGRIRADGITLRGRLEISRGTGASAVRWGADTTLRQPWGALGLFTHYAGVARGLYYPDLSAQAVPTRTRHVVSLTITAQSSDGSATAEVQGLPFQGPLRGRVVASELTFIFDARYVAGALLSSISGRIAPNGRSIIGQYTMDFGSEINRESGTFKLVVMAAGDP